MNTTMNMIMDNWYNNNTAASPPRSSVKWVLPLLLLLIALSSAGVHLLHSTQKEQIKSNVSNLQTKTTPDDPPPPTPPPPPPEAKKDDRTPASIPASTNFYENRPISFTHIPKCSGTSFVSIMEPKYHEQNCYLEMAHHRDGGNTMNCVFIRSPRSHVQSQFLECVYDTWGKIVTSGTAFPRTEDLQDDFKKWLEHFVALDTRTDYGTTVDYNCIDPRNVMARHMSCQRAPNPQANHALSVPPELTVAIENVAKDATFIGVTDFFHESICLLQLRREGSLPPGCGCDAAAEAARNKKKEVHITHDVPPHNSDQFPKDIRIMLDSLTQLDRQLFVAGLKRFMEDMDVAERVVNRKFWCNRTKAYDLLELYSHPREE